MLYQYKKVKKTLLSLSRRKSTLESKSYTEYAVQHDIVTYTGTDNTPYKLCWSTATAYTSHLLTGLLILFLVQFEFYFILFLASLRDTELRVVYKYDDVRDYIRTVGVTLFVAALLGLGYARNFQHVR